MTEPNVGFGTMILQLAENRPHSPAIMAAERVSCRASGKRHDLASACVGWFSATSGLLPSSAGQTATTTVKAARVGLCSPLIRHFLLASATRPAQHVAAG
jgi:hypothetical protein